VLSWDAQLKDVKKEIAELENRVAALREELQAAHWASDAARLQRIIAVREQHLERATFHAQFIESRIAKGNQTAKPIPGWRTEDVARRAAPRTEQEAPVAAVRA
jgi:hypothetical protein